MSVTINVALQQFQCDQWGTDLNLGAIEIYTGAQPAPNAAPTGTLLVSAFLDADAYGAADSSGVAQKNGTVQGTAVASGQAGYARQRNAGSTRWQYGSVSVNGGGGNGQLSTLTITINDVVTINTSEVSQPDGT